MSDVFVDASAMVSIMIGEDDKPPLLATLVLAPRRLTSAVALFETVTALARKYEGDAAGAEERTLAFSRENGMEIVPIGEEIGRLAREAWARYGKGRGHPARLNMGDCLAYACAKHHNVPLLFKGNDFIHTDIEPALAAGA